MSSWEKNGVFSREEPNFSPRALRPKAIAYFFMGPLKGCPEILKWLMFAPYRRRRIATGKERVRLEPRSGFGRIYYKINEKSPFRPIF